MYGKLRITQGNVAKRSLFPDIAGLNTLNGIGLIVEFVAQLVSFVIQMSILGVIMDNVVKVCRRV